jgi:hypothetical protein
MATPQKPKKVEGIIKTTKKRKDEIFLPGTQTPIYQSNRITNGRFKGFSLLQTRFFVSLIKSLQEAIKTEMEGKDWRQLILFDEMNKDMLRVGIQLSDIARPDQYQEVVEAAKSFLNVNVEIESTLGKGRVKLANLLTAVDFPIKVNGKSVVYVEMYKNVGHEIISIEKNFNGRPIKFTRYFFETAIGAKSKYTAKMYMLISSWKSKGGFVTTLENLRATLGLGEEEYTNYNDFKRFVLKPIQKDLEKQSDCWFNCAAKDFEKKEGRKVVGLSIKIITPDVEEKGKERADYVKQLLRMHASFKDVHIAEIQPIFQEGADYQNILFKVQDLVQAIKQGGSTIANPQAYIVKSLLNEFCKQ